MAAGAVLPRVGRFFGAIPSQVYLALGGALAVVLGTVWYHHAINAAEKRGGAAQYQTDKAALDQTAANYRAAADQAKAEDAANAQRVANEQSAINERIGNEYEARLAAARALAGRLREQARAKTNPGSSTGAPVSGLPSTASVIAEAACDRLSDGSFADLRLCATEQGIQLDEIISWTIAQHNINVNNNPPPPAPTVSPPKKKRKLWPF
jgi:hypothetical protein